ncbi:unnamed protein product [Oncorhynchus mykiss]|uniref:SH2 domain-containing protein n=1 Tax=Oncorhynchus mykiss TaxID=8022 RepID=A0A060YH07_ONCMY|nr:unnamed protein product [Oncorhynchus mykiss]
MTSANHVFILNVLCRVCSVSARVYIFEVPTLSHSSPLSQTSQGVQPKRFKSLPELVLLYLQPSQGLVSTLLYPVDREESIPEDRDYSDGEDEKPPLPPRSASTPPTGSSPETPTDSAPAANGLSTISHEYLKGSYALDLQAVKQGASSLPHLNKTLVSSCKRLNG